MRRLPFLLPLLLVAGAFFLLGGSRALSLAALAERQAELRALASAHPVMAPLAFMAMYAACVACMIPAGIVLSMAGGLLFGTVPGTIYTVSAVTLGSVVLVAVARRAMPGAAGRWRAMAAAIEREGFRYILAARLIPFAPFWLTNLAAAATRISLRQFALATAIGIVPITAVLSASGAGLGDTLARGAAPAAADLLRPGVAVPLLLAAGLVLAPVVWRRFVQPGRKSGTDR